MRKDQPSIILGFLSIILGFLPTWGPSFSKSIEHTTEVNSKGPIY